MHGTLDLSVDSDGDGDPTNDVDAVTIQVQWEFPIGQTEISLVVTDSHRPENEADVTTVTVAFMDVQAAIEPGSCPNSIDLGSRGAVPVAFLGSVDFDPSMIDPSIVTVRGEAFYSGLVRLHGKKQAHMAEMEDVNGDGIMDLVVHLETGNLDLDPETVICGIGAMTRDDHVVYGEDTVNIVPPPTHIPFSMDSPRVARLEHQGVRGAGGARAPRSRLP